MATSKKIGPYGYEEGPAFDIDSVKKPPKQLLNITIWSSDGPDGQIKAISFIYRDEKNDLIEVGPYGTIDGTKHMICINKDEFLTGLSGYLNPCITALNFSTSKDAKYGPFGKYPNNIGDIYFSIDVDHDSIVALFGRCDDKVRSIGAYSGRRT
uniref:Uncharacterized protein n=1 Tax=Avena sativa TaxID=4498 RepID=A0ACD5Y5Y8_AVESA